MAESSSSSKATSGSALEKISKIVEVRANGRGWSADRYADLGLFVLMYNRLKNNRTKIIEDLTDPKSPYYLLKTDTPENRKKLENVKAWYNMSSITGDELTWVLRDNIDYFNKAYELEMTPTEIRRISEPGQFKALYEYARELAAGYGHPNEMLTVDEMAQVMEVKAEKSRKVFETYRKNVTSKGDNYYNSKEGHYEGGQFYEDWKNAEKLYKQKSSETKRHGWKAFAFGLLGVGAAALTVTSFLSILPFAGVSFGIGGAAGVVLGLAGTIVGGVLAKIGFGGFFTKIGTWWKNHKDKRDYKLGLGKYKDNDKGLPQSLKGKEDRYWNAHYVRSLFFNYRDLTYIQKEFQIKYIKEHFGSNKKYEELSDSEKAMVDRAFESKYSKYVSVDASGNKKFNKDGIEKEYLRNCAFVKYKDGKKEKYKHKYTVTFEGVDLIDNLWEELVNNYQVSAEGQTGWGGQDDLYWGRFAKVRYNLTKQPTEYAKERMTTQTIAYLIDKHCKDKETDFETLKKDVTGLYELQEDFKGNNDLVTFKELKKQLSARMVEAFKSQILNKGYTDTTVSDIRQMIEKTAKNQDLRNILEDPGEGDNLDDIENLLIWVETEDEAGNKANGEKYVPFTTGIGVSIENQLFIRAQNMLDGAKEINLEAANSNQSTILEIANRIEHMATQDEYDEITEQINSMCSGVADTKQIGYFLQVQLGKRKEEVSYGTADSIATQIGLSPTSDVAIMLGNMLDSSKNIDPNEVRVQIMNSVDEAHQTKALDILARQINAMELRDRNSERREVYDSVKSNSYIGLRNKLAEIRDFKDTDPQKAKEFYEKIVSGSTKDGESDNISDPKIKNYLLSKLRYRIYQDYINEIVSPKFNIHSGVDEVIKNVKELFTNLNSHVEMKTLTSEQRAKLMIAYEPKISVAMTEYLKKMEKYMLVADLSSKYKDEANKMFLPITQQGMGEYLGLGTKETIDFTRRLNALRSDSDVEQLRLSGAFGWAGYKFTETDLPGEMRDTTYSFYHRKKEDDVPLRSLLRSIKNIYKNVGVSSDGKLSEQASALSKNYKWKQVTDSSGNVYYEIEKTEPGMGQTQTDNFISDTKVATNEDKSYIVQTMRLMNSDEFKNMTAQGQLVALTMIKRAAMGLAIGQLNACKQQFADNIPQYNTAMMSSGFSRIQEAWRQFAITLDYKIKQCLAELNKDPDKNSSYCKNVLANTSETLDQITAQKIENLQVVLGSQRMPTDQ